MIRLYLNYPLETKTRVELNIEQSHYLCHVMRQKKGDTLAVFNPKDGEWLAQIYNIGKKYVSVEIQKFQHKSHSQSILWLAFAPLKKDATDFLLEKATELGVTHLQPLWMERSNTQSLNLKRWEKITIEAAEQCERQDIPLILPSIKLASFLNSLPQQVDWFASIEREKSPQLNEILPKKDQCSWGFIVGPEGGFSSQEKGLLAQKSIPSISLGSRILKSETAALSMLAIAQSMIN